MLPKSPDSPRPPSRGQPSYQRERAERAGGGRAISAVAKRSAGKRVPDRSVVRREQAEDGGSLDLGKGHIEVEFRDTRVGYSGSTTALIAIAGMGGEVACAEFAHADPQIAPYLTVAMVAIVAIAALPFRGRRR